MSSPKGQNLYSLLLMQFQRPSASILTNLHTVHHLFLFESSHYLTVFLEKKIEPRRTNRCSEKHRRAFRTIATSKIKLFETLVRDFQSFTNVTTTFVGMLYPPLDHYNEILNLFSYSN